jgi:hypothetical protein
MSVLNQLASAQDRRDEAPNLELAERLAAAGPESSVSIRELVAGLKHQSKATRHDCIKVLYEIGYRQPQLISPFVDDFADQLTSRDNRMIWGAMTALGAAAPIAANAIWPHVDTVLQVTADGSVITQDWGVRVLAALAAADPAYARRTWPFLLNFLRGCRPKDLARHAESVQLAAGMPRAAGELPQILEHRLTDLKPAARRRIEKIISALQA